MAIEDILVQNPVIFFPDVQGAYREDTAYEFDDQYTTHDVLKIPTYSFATTIEFGRLGSNYSHSGYTTDSSGVTYPNSVDYGGVLPNTYSTGDITYLDSSTGHMMFKYAGVDDLTVTSSNYKDYHPLLVDDDYQLVHSDIWIPIRPPIESAFHHSYFLDSSTFITKHDADTMVTNAGGSAFAPTININPFFNLANVPFYLYLGGVQCYSLTITIMNTSYATLEEYVVDMTAKDNICFKIEKTESVYVSIKLSDRYTNWDTTNLLASNNTPKIAHFLRSKILTDVATDVVELGTPIDTFTQSRVSEFKEVLSLKQKQKISNRRYDTFNCSFLVEPVDAELVEHTLKRASFEPCVFALGSNNAGVNNKNFFSTLKYTSTISQFNKTTFQIQGQTAPVLIPDKLAPPQFTDGYPV